VKTPRNRTNRGRAYRHEQDVADGEPVRARGVRVVRRGSDQVVLHVHVHNDINGASARRSGAQTSIAKRRPYFTGLLYGWDEHYGPIAKKMGPVVDAMQRKAERSLLSRLRRIGLLIVALVSIVAVSCHYL
jgi:hypothetical protein